jgi:hypothetical protein
MHALPLAGWENFYVIVGSSAGGLTGLTFVVIALIKDGKRAQPTEAGLRAFVTPTIVHFAGVLGLAAYLSMPHQGVLTVSVGLAAAGLTGVVYAGVVAANLPSLGTQYVPVREDWIWNVILPVVVYAGLLATAIAIWYWTAQTLYAVAALSLALLYIGIRNAWDIAVWMTTSASPETK